MRALHLGLGLLYLVACGGSTTHGTDLCSQANPPPECMTSCDPSATPDTCPAGFHCAEDGSTCTAQCTQGGDECGAGFECSADGRCVPEGQCFNLECLQVDCSEMVGSGSSTILTGTVYAPNGTLPLYGINVYVPNADPGPMEAGAQCSRCTDNLSGQPLVKAVSDEAGHFVLENVPAGENIPLVFTSGKWRRQVTMTVPACSTTEVPAELSRLPAKKSEGDIPLIALSTGDADALECLLRKLGIDDSEYTGDTGDGRVHLYSDDGASGGEGTDRFSSGFPGGSGDFPDSQTLWSSVDKLKLYDIVILSCEGGQFPETKSQADMDAIKAYADLGGRIFMSHWHNVWIEGAGHEGQPQAPAVWTDIATWNNSNTTFTGTDAIDEVNNPKGMSFATWMLNVMGSTSRGEIPIQGDTGKNTCDSVDLDKAEQWVTWDSGGGDLKPQTFQFTTPNEAPAAQRCGKVVFSDMHVSGDSESTPGGDGFPTLCSNDPLTPQEKALAFMLFDLASCVDVID